MSVQCGDESGGSPEPARLESFGKAPRRSQAQRTSAVSSQQTIEGQTLRDDDGPLTELPRLVYATDARRGRGPPGGDRKRASLDFDDLPGCGEARPDPLRDGHADRVADQHPAHAFLGNMGRPA